MILVVRNKYLELEGNRLEFIFFFIFRCEFFVKFVKSIYWMLGSNKYSFFDVKVSGCKEKLEW